MSRVLSKLVLSKLKPPKKKYSPFLENISKFLSFCSLLEANARIVTEERGLQDICQAMDTHQDICDVMEAACSAIWSLSMEGLKN